MRGRAGIKASQKGKRPWGRWVNGGWIWSVRYCIFVLNYAIESHYYAQIMCVRVSHTNQNILRESALTVNLVQPGDERKTFQLAWGKGWGGCCLDCHGGPSPLRAVSSREGGLGLVRELAKHDHMSQPANTPL